MHPAQRRTSPHIVVSATHEHSAKKQCIARMTMHARYQNMNYLF
jgi:hypothetical protein